MLKSILAHLSLLLTLVLLFFWVSLGSDAQEPRQPEPRALEVPVSFRALSLSEALHLPLSAAELAAKGLAMPCRPPPLVRSATFANIQETPPWRALGSINLGEPLSAYFGTLHGHSAASDGAGAPEEAFRHARDVAQLDFFALTDHSEYWLLTHPEPFRAQQHLAERFTTADFVAIAGFEYSSMLYGHYVVLGSDGVHHAFQDGSLLGFYDWLAMERNANAVAIFAHPGFHEYRRGLEFSHFAFDPRLASRMLGVEVIHWDGYQRLLWGYGGRFAYIDEALRRGWYVGPLGSEDVHAANWGTRDSARVALLLPKLAKREIFAALRRRHFYATNNRDLQFAVNLHLGASQYASMGDFLPAEFVRGLERRGARALLTARYYDQDCAAWPRRLEVIVNGVVVGVHEFAARGGQQAFPHSGEFRFELGVDTLRRFQPAGGHAYAYVRFYQGDDLETFTQSAPIFFPLPTTTPQP